MASWNNVKGSFPMKYWKVSGFAQKGGPVDNLRDGDLLVFYEVGTEKRIARYRPIAGQPPQVIANWATQCDEVAGVVKGHYMGGTLTNLKITLSTPHVCEVHSHAVLRDGGSVEHGDALLTDGSTWHGDEGP
jgi:hypothetical protein